MAQTPVVVGGSGLPAVEVNLDVLGVFEDRTDGIVRPPLPGAAAASQPVRLHPPTAGARPAPLSGRRIVLAPPAGVPRLRMPAIPTGRVRSAPILRPPKTITARRASASRTGAAGTAPLVRPPPAPRAFARSMVPELIVVPPAPRRKAPSRTVTPAPRKVPKAVKLRPPPKAARPRPAAPPKAVLRPPATPTRIAKLPPPPRVARPQAPKAPPAGKRPAPRSLAPRSPTPVPAAPPKATRPTAPPPAPTTAAKPAPPRKTKPAPPPAAPSGKPKPPIETARLAPPAPAKAPSAAVPAPAGRPATGPLLSLRFSGGSTRLSGDAERQLTRLAGRLSETGARLQLKAYAGASGGTASTARRLSLSRALSVRSYLIGKGVRSTRIDVRALGLTDDGGPEDRVDILLFER